MTTRVEVDFNSRDDWGMIPAPLGGIDGPYRVGDTVEAFDDEGNRCTGLIASIAADSVAFEPFWPTFAPPDANRLIVTSARGFTTRWTSGLTVAISARLRPMAASTGGTQSVKTRFTGSEYYSEPHSVHQ